MDRSREARYTDAAAVTVDLNNPDLVLDIPIAPAAVVARVSGAINRRERRMFGILKTKQEFVGYADADSFEIWERQQRAVHAVASVRPRSGGTRIELRFVLPRTTKVVTAVFFTLYAVVAVGIAQRPPESGLSGSELAAMAVGVAVLVAGFTIAARRQRADLAAFVSRLFPEVARPPD